jgi:hypothetical protein
MRRRTNCLIVLLVVAAIWVIGFGCWPLLVWSPLNCSHHDIDINSGRVRHQGYLVGLCVCEVVEETTISRLLADEVSQKPASWQRVSTFSPMVHHSPHYRYHAAISQIHEVDRIWELAQFTPAAKRQMARNVLSLWQRGEGYGPVSKYLESVYQVSHERQKHNKTVDVKDLPIIEPGK